MPRFKVVSNGSDHEMVTITGDPKRCEPSHFTVKFPGGHVNITRANNGSNAEYWVHFHANRENDLVEDSDMQIGKIVKARIDGHDKPTSEYSVGDIGDPSVYHLAVRIQPV